MSYNLDNPEHRQLLDDAALGREIRYEIERYGDPHLMGVVARVEAGDGFTQHMDDE